MAEKDERPVCSCGKPARIIVEGMPLCEEHRAGWLTEENEAIRERRIQNVMKALDRVCEQDNTGPWDVHLRHMAVAAIEAAAA